MDIDLLTARTTLNYTIEFDFAIAREYYCYKYDDRKCRIIIFAYILLLAVDNCALNWLLDVRNELNTIHCINQIFASH